MVKKTKILKVNEYVDLMNQQKLNEKATINSPKDINMPFNKFSVTVNSNDLTPPHFHFRCIDKRVELKIEITTLNIIHSTPRKGVNDIELTSWIGLSAEKKYLKNWLESIHMRDKSKNNYTAIVYMWNTFHDTYSEIDINTKNPWN